MNPMKLRLRQRLIYFIVAAILEYLAWRWPNLPLPSPETVSDWVFAALATHGVGDTIRLGVEFFGAKIRGIFNRK